MTLADKALGCCSSSAGSLLRRTHILSLLTAHVRFSINIFFDASTNAWCAGTIHFVLAGYPNDDEAENSGWIWTATLVSHLNSLNPEGRHAPTPPAPLRRVVAVVVDPESSTTRASAPYLFSIELSLVEINYAPLLPAPESRRRRRTR